MIIEIHNGTPICGKLIRDYDTNSLYGWARDKNPISFDYFINSFTSNYTDVVVFFCCSLRREIPNT
jgi:hypothetical protein